MLSSIILYIFMYVLLIKTWEIPFSCVHASRLLIFLLKRKHTKHLVSVVYTSLSSYDHLVPLWLSFFSRLDSAFAKCFGGFLVGGFLFWFGFFALLHAAETLPWNLLVSFFFFFFFIAGVLSTGRIASQTYSTKFTRK